MIDSVLGLGVVLVTLAVFAVVGFRTRTSDLDVEEYMVARNSQRSGVLALSFLASGLGAWILFAPPEVGAGIGVVAVVGYAVAAATPVVLFGLLGRRMRTVVPSGHSLSEFVRVRFGRPFHLFVVGVSVAYMLLFLTAELTAVGAVAELLAGTDPRWTILAVAVVTLAYTAYGGLRASLRTDRWQAWLIIGLVAAGGVALFAPGLEREALAETGLVWVDRLGIEVAITLVIAVTAANLFHQGYWQRVWAAADERTLSRGAWAGAALVVPVVAVVGLLGVVAVARGLDVGAPAVPFFALLAELPGWVGAVAIALGVALVASSVDTLQNGLASLAAAERPTMRLGTARIVTAALMVPAAAIALQGHSVLRLFLIADLLCAAIVVPALAGLWARVTSAGALAGGVAGLAGAVLPGLVTAGSLVDGVTAATFPDAIPTLPPFAGALVASALVTLVVSWRGRRTVDLGEVGDAVERRAVAARQGGEG